MRRYIVLASLLTACGPGQGKKKDRTSEPVPATTAEVQAGLDASCGGCHKQASDRNHHVNLTDITQGVAPAEHAYVQPGCPEQSRLYVVLRDGVMPPREPKATEEQVAKVASWINSLEGDCL